MIDDWSLMEGEKPLVAITLRANHKSFGGPPNVIIMCLVLPSDVIASDFALFCEIGIVEKLVIYCSKNFHEVIGNLLNGLTEKHIVGNGQTMIRVNPCHRSTDDKNLWKLSKFAT